MRVIEISRWRRGVMGALKSVMVAALMMPIAESANAQSVVGWGETGFSNIDDMSELVHVAAGDSHTVALKADGTVACWGSNGHGQ